MFIVVSRVSKNYFLPTVIYLYDSKMSRLCNKKRCVCLYIINTDLKAWLNCKRNLVHTFLQTRRKPHKGGKNFLFKNYNFVLKSLRMSGIINNERIQKHFD